eukprot:3107665-Lingulodinium_polyedra.AAC.1
MVEIQLIDYDEILGSEGEGDDDDYDRDLGAVLATWGDRLQVQDERLGRAKAALAVFASRREAAAVA